MVGNNPNEVSIRSLKGEDAPMLAPSWEIGDGSNIMSLYHRDNAVHEVVL